MKTPISANPPAAASTAPTSIRPSTDAARVPRLQINHTAPRITVDPRCARFTESFTQRSSGRVPTAVAIPLPTRKKLSEMKNVSFPKKAMRSCRNTRHSSDWPVGSPAGWLGGGRLDFLGTVRGMLGGRSVKGRFDMRAAL
jgi:hypothetical protein